MADAPLRRHPHAAARTYEGKALIVVPGLGQYNILNPMGTRVWELIDGTRGIDEIVRAITDEYDVTPESAETDVRDFIEDLRRHDIVS
jgi:hypothetical protein